MQNSGDGSTYVGGDQINVGGHSNIGKIVGADTFKVDQAALIQLVLSLKTFAQEAPDPDARSELTEAIVVLERQSQNVDSEEPDFWPTLDKVKDVLTKIGQGAAGSAVATALLQLISRI